MGIQVKALPQTRSRVRQPLPCEDHQPQGIERLFIGQEVTVFRRANIVPEGIEPSHYTRGRGDFHNYIVTQRMEEGVRIARDNMDQQREREIAEQRFREANPEQ